MKQTAPGPVPEGAVQARTLGGRVAIVLERKQRGWFAVELDGNANDEGEAYERKPLRRPQFAPGQDALLDSAPESEAVKAVAAQKAAAGPKPAKKPAPAPAAEGAPPTMKKQSGYLYHCAQNREAAKAAVAAAQPDLNAQEQNQAVMKRLGEMASARRTSRRSWRRWSSRSTPAGSWRTASTSWRSRRSSGTTGSS